MADVVLGALTGSPHACSASARVGVALWLLQGGRLRMPAHLRAALELLGQLLHADGSSGAAAVARFSSSEGVRAMAPCTPRAAGPC